MTKVSGTIACVMGAMSAMWLTDIAHAAYPERPIRIVVPLPAGTSPDLFARYLGQKLSAALKQPVIIENRPGANSVIGTAVVAKRVTDFLDIPALVSVSGVVSYKSNSWGLF